MDKKLYRSRRVRIISGVAGGLADYFDIDVSLLRLLIALGTLFTGVFPGVILYLIAAMVIPEEEEEAVFHGEPSGFDEGSPERDSQWESSGTGKEVFTGGESSHASRKNAVVFGGFLIIVGALLLVQRIFPTILRWRYLWPMFLIILGISVVAGSFRRH
jgi:phage shock protein C